MYDCDQTQAPTSAEGSSIELMIKLLCLAYTASARCPQQTTAPQRGISPSSADILQLAEQCYAPHSYSVVTEHAERCSWHYSEPAGLAVAEVELLAVPDSGRL
jgi:hypothetical protein